MKAIRGRADARWLPSRHRFAIFRLWAFLRLRKAKPEPRPGLILIVDRDQTAFEHHGMSLWLTLSGTCYVAVTLFRALPLPVALLLAFPTTAALIEVPFNVAGLLIRRGARVNGWVFLAVFAAVSFYIARQPSWARFVAWQFFGVLAINGLAAVVVFLLRDAIARAERGVVSES